MAERARPDDPGFKRSWGIRWLFGAVPIPAPKPNPYRDALFWRYSRVAAVCRGKDVVDIPCGVGWGTSMLHGCRSLVGLDISEEAIRDARRWYGSGIEFRVGDMSRLDLADQSVDLVSCLEGIEHVPTLVAEAFVRECHRVLRPDRDLMMSSPHCTSAAHSGNPYHYKEYRPHELRALVAPYFRVVAEESRIVDNLTVTMFHLRRAAHSGVSGSRGG